MLRFHVETATTEIPCVKLRKFNVFLCISYHIEVVKIIFLGMGAKSKFTDLGVKPTNLN